MVACVHNDPACAFVQREVNVRACNDVHGYMPAPMYIYIYMLTCSMYIHTCMQQQRFDAKTIEDTTTISFLLSAMQFLGGFWMSSLT